ncbi:hypothetical protein ROA7450_03304 [Roseovarius albus]|uniref:Uncharacterized protein n=1 Tax=Roseovarius albus TaxID=1247867 RepID=A0A1X6ZVX8_9RHOB|nr:hypothetical protein ROA7450_03304 [Roseovarius albus]
MRTLPATIQNPAVGTAGFLYSEPDDQALGVATVQAQRVAIAAQGVGGQG